MELSQKQRNKLADKLKGILRDRTCLMCSHGKCFLGNVLEMHSYNEKGIQIDGAPVYPVVELVCEECGYMRLFNAIVLGLISADTGMLSELYKEEKP